MIVRTKANTSGQKQDRGRADHLKISHLRLQLRPGRIAATGVVVRSIGGGRGLAVSGCLIQGG